MKTKLALCMAACAAFAALLAAAQTSPAAKSPASPAPSNSAAAPTPFTVSLDCGSGDCSLLHGAPQTAGMMSGFVRLQPGKSVGWHTTGAHEEALVILKGSGEAQIEGRADMRITAPMMVYIPPQTRHNVSNNSVVLLEYVYLVAPAK